MAKVQTQKEIKVTSSMRKLIRNIRDGKNAVTSSNAGTAMKLCKHGFAFHGTYGNHSLLGLTTKGQQLN